MTARNPPVMPETLAAELDRCLALARGKAEGFDRAATTWLSRWCVQLPGLSLAEACNAMDALRSLGRPASAPGGARLLQELVGRHGCADLEAVLDRWIAAQDR